MGQSKAKISTRLSIAFLVMVLMSVTLGAIALIRATVQERVIDELTQRRIPIVKALNTITDDVNEQMIQSRNLLIFVEKEFQDSAHDGIREKQADVQQQIKLLNELVHSEDGKALLQKLQGNSSEFMQMMDRLTPLVSQGNSAAAHELLKTTLRPVQLSYQKITRELLEQQEQRVVLASQRAEASNDALQRDVTIMLALVVLLGICLSAVIIRSISRPLDQAVSVANLVSSGDLGIPIVVQSSNEVGLLLRALQRMQKSLVVTVGAVHQGASSVASASAQIAAGNVDLSARTEGQASALEQTSASMEELSSIVKQNADSAREANQAALATSDVAVRGGAIVTKVVGTMKIINDSSRKISEIIGVIDGIAFQTNILSLNAAVEAARAGEQGRGFAVVASEVRALAQRSAEAAKEIKKLISASVERVEQGTVLVDEAGKTMVEVVSSIRRVTDLMSEISEASHEQAARVLQVREAVVQMDQNTQENAALVEEMATAAASLSEQAQMLVGTVGTFKLGTMDATSLPEGAPPILLTATTQMKVIGHDGSNGR
ncbi:HAMP domain-containing protein [Herbaspirillum frisingense]|uniref:methyl-accepting chemotaxis protein n=1 Tax=Herbaspirillum frisingense TaxID=92645 RepID=UPI001602864C|nr:methyl-accepting chemotaxis protein [Herbaspirillum frisingense]QNB06119.1 HAMP domain-containing protein [Herbaspirillum frisingense]